MPDEAGYVVWPFLIGVRIKILQQFLRPLDLSVPYIALIFHHLPGERNDKVLLQLSLHLYCLTPAVLNDIFSQPGIHCAVGVDDLVGAVIVKISVSRVCPVEVLHVLQVNPRRVSAISENLRCSQAVVSNYYLP